MKLPETLLRPRALRLGIASFAALGMLVAVPASAQAASTPPVGLGTAKTFAVLAGTTITNTGATKISGDVGLNPGKAAAVTGFPPAVVTSGTTHAADAVSLQAKADLGTAYDDASGRTPPVSVISKDLGGQTLTPGVYKSTIDLGLTGTLTLDGQNDPNAVFIFQGAQGLKTASTSKVNLINGASSCNVFWQVTSSATLGSDSSFRGTIMALTSISLDTRASVDGRMLARNGAVTLQANTINSSTCVVGTAAATPSAQVTQVPKGDVSTGDGSTSGGGSGLGLLSGLLAFAGIGGAAVVATRRRRLNV